MEFALLAQARMGGGPALGRGRGLPMTLENTRPDNAEAARLFMEDLKGGAGA